MLHYFLTNIQNHFAEKRKSRVTINQNRSKNNYTKSNHFGKLKQQTFNLHKLFRLIIRII